MLTISPLLAGSSSSRKSTGSKSAFKRKSDADVDDSDDFQESKSSASSRRGVASRSTDYNEDEEDSSCLCDRGYEEVSAFP
jgi:hypothetical protein